MRYADITNRLQDLGGAKWAVHQKARQLQDNGADIVELTIGEPDVRVDSSLIEIAHDSLLAGRLAYSDGRGEADLLDALVERYEQRRPGVTRENFLCFPGAQTALFATMMGIADKGSHVMLGDPYYASYEGVIRASGGEPLPVPLRAENDFRLQVEDLQAALTPNTRALLINTPHNPSGAVLSAEDIQKIGKFCKEHELWLISDEVYEDLIYEGTFASPFDTPEFEDFTVIVSSISKSCAAPGFRSGWAAGSAEFCERLLSLSETMLFGNQPFIADVTAFALRNPPPTAAIMREDYRRRRDLICDGLSGVEGLHPYKPQAGMFVMVDVSATGFQGDAFASQLLNDGVAVMPGPSFGKNAGSLIRLSLTVPDEKIKIAVQRIIGFTQEL